MNEDYKRYYEYFVTGLTLFTGMVVMGAIVANCEEANEVKRAALQELKEKELWTCDSTHVKEAYMDTIIIDTLNYRDTVFTEDNAEENNK